MEYAPQLNLTGCMLRMDGGQACALDMSPPSLCDIHLELLVASIPHVILEVI